MKRRRQNEFVNDTATVDNHGHEMVVLRHPHKSQLLSAGNTNDMEFKYRIELGDASDTLCKRLE